MPKQKGAAKVRKAAMVRWVNSVAGVCPYCGLCATSLTPFGLCPTIRRAIIWLIKAHKEA
jgi:hypothetical protein